MSIVYDYPTILSEYHEYDDAVEGIEKSNDRISRALTTSYFIAMFPCMKPGEVLAFLLGPIVDTIANRQTN